MKKFLLIIAMSISMMSCDKKTTTTLEVISELSGEYSITETISIVGDLVNPHDQKLIKDMVIALHDQKSNDIAITNDELVTPQEIARLISGICVNRDISVTRKIIIGNLSFEEEAYASALNSDRYFYVGCLTGIIATIAALIALVAALGHMLRNY